MLFGLPLLFSVIGVGVYLTTEAEWRWKALASGLVVSSLLFQFVGPLRTHFLVPALMQVIVSIWMIFALGLHRQRL